MIHRTPALMHHVSRHDSLVPYAVMPRRSHAVIALASNDPLSLVNGARTQAKNRDSIKGRWDKRRMSARSKVVPIEPPEELPDEGQPGISILV